MDEPAAIARVDALLGEVEALPDPAARETATALAQALLELHGEGLGRLIGHVSDQAELAAAVGDDPVVANMLLLHGLHPVPLEQRVRGALDEVRPYLETHGGNVELVGVEDGCRAPASGGQLQRLPLLAGDARARDRGGDPRRRARRRGDPGRGRSGGAGPDPDRAGVPGAGAMTTTRLRDLAQRSAAAREATLERCDLCSAPIPPGHRHLLEVETGEMQCACRACALLFDRDGTRYKLVPERRLRLDGLALDDVMWAELRLPVDIAFFHDSSRHGRVVAHYPSPMGATESQLDLAAWDQLVAENPVLGTLEPDTEALLVNRAQGARRQWLVPIDECFSLVGLIRTRWRGLTGGREVWQAIGSFCDDLDRRSRRTNREEAAPL